MGGAKRRDPLTRWWRGITLRSKITGVTVAALALGLTGAGLGTVPFLHNAFIRQIEESLIQTPTDALAEQLFVVTKRSDGNFDAEPRESASNTSSVFAALYSTDGTLLAVSGRTDGPQPAYPKTSRVDQAYDITVPFGLDSTTGNSGAFRAVAHVVPVSVFGTDRFFTLIIASPTKPAESYIAAYLAIFGALASVTMFIAALLTRYAVTLAFRRLGQVESTAMAIAGGNFTQRMPDAEPHTEVGRLKLAINTMLGRLDAAIVQRDASVTQMRRFIGDASHELRTPLVTVRGYAELYRMGAIKGEDNTTQAMERIEKEALRMGNLVEDLLALARLDERRPVEFTDVDLRPVARDAAMDLTVTDPDRIATFIDTTIGTDGPKPRTESFSEATQRRTAGGALSATMSRLRRRSSRTVSTEAPLAGPQATSAGFSSAVTHPGSVEPIVRGDEDKIRQVVTNLLGNARRYTPEGSPIEVAVGTAPDADTAWIAVIDHGDGIPEQQREQIFQRFWRADTSRARETGGSGLGLAIVASIVDSLHGSISVEETPGGGATFRVSVPLATSAARNELPGDATQPMESLGRPTAQGLPKPPRRGTA